MCFVQQIMYKITVILYFDYFNDLNIVGTAHLLNNNEKCKHRTEELSL